MEKLKLKRNAKCVRVRAWLRVCALARKIGNAAYVTACRQGRAAHLGLRIFIDT